MTDFERSVIRMNDLRAGRVIPTWRYSVMSILTLVLISVARILPNGFWISFGVMVAWIIAYAFLIGPYKMRGIS